MPITKTYKSYPYRLQICTCVVPEIESWGYHLIGGDEYPRLLPGTSFKCKCGGHIDRKIGIPEDIKDRVDYYWDHPENW